MLFSLGAGLTNAFTDDGKPQSQVPSGDSVIATDPFELNDYVLHSRDTYNGIIYDVEKDGTMIASSGYTTMYYTFGEASVKNGKFMFTGQQNDKLKLFEKLRCAQNYTEEAVKFSEHDHILAVFNFKALGAIDDVTISPVLRKQHDSAVGEMYLTPFNFAPYINEGEKAVTILFEMDRELDELNYYVFIDGAVTEVVTGCEKASNYYFSAFELGFTMPPSLLTAHYEVSNVSVFVSKN